MSVRKFIAPTTREALREIRSELGEEAVIISNRKVGQGVEIIAMSKEDITQIADRSVAHIPRPFVPPRVTVPPQGFVPPKFTAPQQTFVPPPEAAFHQASVQSSVEPTIAAVDNSRSEAILHEIKSMHVNLQQQLSTMAWGDVQQRDPQRAGLLRGLLNAGFSTSLASQLIEKMPIGKTQAATWIKQVLKTNLRFASEIDDVVTRGGVFALIGPTGVGKTTTTAKLAARAVVRYGSDKVALLTTDSYRIGAYEQLKIYGKILGISVQAVKGTDDLRLTLSSLRNKHLVLIDTVGMGQRDERVANQTEMFDAANVPRLLLLNSTSSGDTLEDVVRMYHSKKVIGCIPTKLDEAVNLGAVLDVALRHRLVLHYMANGQRVPEDLHPINLDYLLHRAIKAAEQSTPYKMHELQFPVLMAAGGPPQRAGMHSASV